MLYTVLVYTNNIMEKLECIMAPVLFVQAVQYINKSLNLARK